MEHLHPLLSVQVFEDFVIVQVVVDRQRDVAVVDHQNALAFYFFDFGDVSLQSLDEFSVSLLLALEFA